ncbi:PH domain protein [Aspergillus luchuensis]|uniref:PH domain protein n=1 Tax=Aspergillus kawachii TaxID=1069201 RepID=A0A146G3F1_ASPKA|nr:PH domain protein [Aspergillus luchuensis]
MLVFLWRFFQHLAWCAEHLPASERFRGVAEARVLSTAAAKQNKRQSSWSFIYEGRILQKPYSLALPRVHYLTPLSPVPWGQESGPRRDVSAKARRAESRRRIRVGPLPCVLPGDGATEEADKPNARIASWIPLPPSPNRRDSTSQSETMCQLHMVTVGLSTSLNRIGKL